MIQRESAKKSFQNLFDLKTQQDTANLKRTGRPNSRVEQVFNKFIICFDFLYNKLVNKLVIYRVC